MSISAWEPRLAGAILSAAAFEPRRCAIKRLGDKLLPNDVYRVFHDLAYAHEYVHFVQHCTTTYGLLLRMMWEQAILTFAQELKTLVVVL